MEVDYEFIQGTVILKKCSDLGSLGVVDGKKKLGNTGECSKILRGGQG